MGFLNFLKPKKGRKAESAPMDVPLPPSASEPDLYSELPNLPDAPELSGLPEIELPQPLKGLEDLEIPERQEPEPAEGAEEKLLLPKWQGAAQEAKLPELPKLPPEEKSGDEEKHEPWLKIPAEIPELRPYTSEPAGEHEATSGRLISQNNAFFLKADDFRMVRDNLDKLAKAQRKHHSLTDLKKEENEQYDRINALAEEIQRKLMHIDRTLFD